MDCDYSVIKKLNKTGHESFVLNFAMQLNTDNATLRHAITHIEHFSTLISFMCDIYVGMAVCKPQQQLMHPKKQLYGILTSLSLHKVRWNVTHLMPR